MLDDGVGTHRRRVPDHVRLPEKLLLSKPEELRTLLHYGHQTHGEIVWSRGHLGVTHILAVGEEAVGEGAPCVYIDGEPHQPPSGSVTVPGTPRSASPSGPPRRVGAQVAPSCRSAGGSPAEPAPRCWGWRAGPSPDLPVST